MTDESLTAGRRYIVLGISTTIQFTMSFMVAAVNIAIPTMQKQYSMEAWVTAWLGMVYFLSVAVVQVPAGRLADIYGRKRMFIIGLTLTITASFLGMFTSSVPMLFACLVLLGMGTGVVFNNSISILTSVFPAEKRGSVLGISASGTYIGLSTGPYIGGLITRAFTWQSMFVVSAVLYTVLLGLVIYVIRGKWRESEGAKFDFVGTAAYIVSVALFIYGFSSLPDIPGFILLVVGIAGFAFFARWEKRTSSPIFDLSLFSRNRVFLFANLSMFLSYVATYSIPFLLSLYLQEIKGQEADEAGLILIVASVLMAICTPIAGRVSDRIAPRLVASVGVSLNVVTLFMLAFISGDTPLWYIIIALSFYGFGIGFFSSPNANAVISSVDRKSLGIAAGTMGTMRTSGMVVCYSIISVIFSMFMGDAEITPEYYPQFLSSARAIFAVMTGLGVLGVISQLVAVNGNKKLRSG